MRTLRKLDRLDFYPKTFKDFEVKTYSGAAISILSALIILWLFIAELSYYFSINVNPELSVDTSRGDTIKINFHITFPKLPCSYLTVDVLDSSGYEQLDVIDNIYKQRLNENGEPLEGIHTRERIASKTTATEAEAKVTARPPDYCGSCYGAAKEGQCCNTCEDVRKAYSSKGWAFKNPQDIEQCKSEGWVEKMDAQKNEGCRVYGHVVVNKVAGNFHFAPGQSFQEHHSHVHDLNAFNMKLWNTSHEIHSFSFGTHFPGVVNPLDVSSKHIPIDETKGGVYQYFIKVIPTVYERLDGQVIKTYQYSVTDQYKPLAQAHTGHGGGLPGVFFMYDISPIMVKYTESSKSFSHFLTAVCAIVGGVLTVSALIDSFVYNSLRSLAKKIDLGKAF